MALDNDGEDTGDPVELDVPIGVGLFSTGFKLTFGMELLDDMVLVLGAEVVVDFMVGLKGGGFEVVALGLDVGVVFVNVGFGCEIFVSQPGIQPIVTRLILRCLTKLRFDNFRTTQYSYPCVMPVYLSFFVALDVTTSDAKRKHFVPC